MSKLSLHVGSEISLKDFSFSQLIIAVKNLFDTEGLPGLVKVLVVLSLSRMRCLSCKKTFVPFNRLLDLDQYSRRSREFEKLTLETVTNQSFRRSAKNLNDTMGFNTAHTTLHRWFENTDATNLSVNHRVDFLVTDGTGFKKDHDENVFYRGELGIHR